MNKLGLGLNNCENNKSSCSETYSLVNNYMLYLCSSETPVSSQALNKLVL